MGKREKILLILMTILIEMEPQEYKVMYGTLLNI